MSPESATRPDGVLLLGEEEARYGEYRLEVLPALGVACCLSVGADPTSPSLANKGDPRFPNEDALLVRAAGTRVLLAVADAHYGRFASHALLRRLAEAAAEVPGSPADLLRVLRGCALPEAQAVGDSASTLLVTVLRRDLGAAFGFSFGDSTCAAVGGGHDGRALNRPSDAFVSPGVPGSLDADRASFFEVDVPPGSLLLAFTDGVDRCHYGQAHTSLGPAQFAQLFDEVGPDPATYACRLTEWALAGRDGHPGGQDNVALIAAAT